MKLTRKILVSLLLVVMVASMIPTASATFDRTYTARYGSPFVDGEIDDVWDIVDWTYVDKPHDGDASTDSAVRVKLLWDESNLFFLAEITDNSYNENYDMLEFYLDQTNNKSTNYGSDDSQTRFRLNGKVVTGVASVAGKNAQTDAEYMVVREGNKFVMEGGLFYTAGTPQAGNMMGLEFMYQDAKAGLNVVDVAEYENGDAEAYRWNIDQANGDKAAWESTVHWGTLIFADEDGNVPKDVPTLTAKETEPPTEATTTAAPVTTERETPKVVWGSKDTTASATTAQQSQEPAGTGLPLPVLFAIIGAGVGAVAAVVIIIVKKKKNQ